MNQLLNVYRSLSATLAFALGRVASPVFGLSFKHADVARGDLVIKTRIDAGEQRQYIELCRRQFPDGTGGSSGTMKSRAIFYLFRGPRLVGFAVFRTHVALLPWGIYPLLMQIYIVKSERRKGLAELLLEQAFNCLPTTTIYLFVDGNAGVKDLYYRMGFRDCGALLWRRNFVVMRKDFFCEEITGV